MPPESPSTDPTTDRATPAWRVFGIPAVLALVGYLLLYSCDARLRTQRGPWEVAFHREADGTPALEIRQPNLGITGVRVRFPGETAPETLATGRVDVAFDAPRQAVPMGTLVFDDLMYQPGTVVLQCFGHEVQMLPRALYLNRKAHAWQGTATFDLTPEMKPAALPGPPPRGPRRPTGP